MKQWYIRVMGILSILLLMGATLLTVVPIEDGYIQLRFVGLLMLSVFILFLAYIPYGILVILQGGKRYERIITGVVVVNISYYFILKLLVALYPITIAPLYIFYEKLNLLIMLLGVLGWIVLGITDLVQRVKKISLK